MGACDKANSPVDWRSPPPAWSDVPDGEADNLERLLGGLADATGVAFALTQEVRGSLRQTPTGLLANLTVPAAEAWPWVEGLLLHNGFRLGALSARAPHLIAVYDLGPGRRPVRLVSHLVAPSDLPAYAEHQALLIQTSLHLPHTDVRQLGNSLRALATDPSGLQSVVPVGDSNSLILTGDAQEVLLLAQALLEINEVARTDTEARRSASPEGRPPPPTGGR